MQTIINRLNSEVNTIEKTIKALKDAKIKTFWPKTLDTFNNKYNIQSYFKKDSIDVLNSFNIKFEYFSELHKYNKFDYIRVNVFTPEQAIIELEKLLPYKIKALKKAKNTIKKEKTILNKMLKLDALIEELSYKNYDSEILQKIASKNYKNFTSYKTTKLFW